MPNEFTARRTELWFPTRWGEATDEPAREDARPTTEDRRSVRQGFVRNRARSLRLIL